MSNVIFRNLYSFLASEIECGIFEEYVAPALDNYKIVSEAAHGVNSASALETLDNLTKMARLMIDAIAEVRAAPTRSQEDWKKLNATDVALRAAITEAQRVLNKEQA